MCSEITNVMQCWVKHRELPGKDVFVHAKGLGVVVGDVESLLAEHHADLGRQRAGKHNQESISCSLLTDDHLWIPPALQQRSNNLMESGNTDVATEEQVMKNTLQMHLSSSRLPFVSIKGKPEPLCEACLGFSCTRHLFKYSLFIKGGQSHCRMPL